MQSNSALRLVNSAASAVTPAQEAARKRAARVPSPAEQMVHQNLTLLSQTYTYVLTDDQRRAYKDLGQVYPVGKTGSTQAQSVFIAVNSLRLQAGMDILLDPGPFRGMLPVMVDYTLMASNIGGVFTLIVTPGIDYSASLTIITATKPLSPGVMEINKGQYQFLTTADNLVHTGVDLHLAYVSTFGRAAAAGTRVGVCLTPITATGFPGSPIYHDVMVSGS